MSASELIVDASSWIDFFHGIDLPPLEVALKRGGVVLPPIVVSELVSGARTPRDLALLTDLLTDLPVHETSLEHWIRVGELRKFLRDRGWLSRHRTRTWPNAPSNAARGCSPAMEPFPRWPSLSRLS